METSKRQIRERVLKLIHQQTKDEQLAKSRIIQSRLFELPEFKEAKTVLFYASCPGEVQTIDMIRSAKQLGKTIGLPKIFLNRKIFLPVMISDLEKDVAAGAYGILEPSKDEPVMDPNTIDLAVVPGIAFDRDNNRLGRGGGYYDKFLSDAPSTVRTVGLAYDIQMIDHIPCLQDHDIPVDRVLTN